MAFLDMFGAERSTIWWGAKLFKTISRGDWDFARENKLSIFRQMAASRRGTPSVVFDRIEDGSLRGLGDLCTLILLSEALRVNPSDIPDITYRVKKGLEKKGIPYDLC